MSASVSLDPPSHVFGTNIVIFPWILQTVGGVSFTVKVLGSGDFVSFSSFSSLLCISSPLVLKAQGFPWISEPAVLSEDIPDSSLPIKAEVSAPGNLSHSPLLHWD